jgi:hypothetical protein
MERSETVEGVRLCSQQTITRLPPERWTGVYFPNDMKKEKYLMKAEPFSRTRDESSSLHIIQLNPRTDPRWEAFMTRFSNSVIYQHPAWLAVVEEAYGYTPMHLACEDSTGNLRGILPLFYRRGLRSGKQCISPPLVAGPLSDDRVVDAMLIQAATERSREVHATRFLFTNRSTNFDHLVNNVIGVPEHETYIAVA